MKTWGFTISVVLAIGLTLVQANAPDSEGPRGVSPSRANLYTADTSGNWRCLDGSKTISFKAINDDFCDCPDGSDEPGTPACGNTFFYCANVGHTPAYLKTSRLNDGVCDPECCDGTDEFDGMTHCANICEQVGAKARKERERIRKVVKEGSRIRKNYIEFGKSAKKKLLDQLEVAQSKAVVIKQKAAEAKAELDSAKAEQQEQIDSGKAEREEARRKQLEPLIVKQQQMITRAMDSKLLLRTAMEDLKENQNKNYHDMAVKEAITGFDQYLEQMKQEAVEESKTSQEQDPDLTAEQQFSKLQDQAFAIRKEIGWIFQLLKAMKENYNTEYNDEAVLKAVSVLSEFEPSWKDDKNEFVGEEVIDLLPEEDALIPPTSEKLATPNAILSRVQRVLRLVGLGALLPDTRSELDRTSDAYNKALDEDRKLDHEIQDIERKIGIDYGKDESFAQLAGQCFQFKDIEYTYSVCLFGDATQKSNSDTSLGTPAVCSILSGTEDEDVISEPLMPDVTQRESPKKHDEL
ncbi:hypothetical protein BGZ98_000232 [Dissophora globulifera]|nr:hypothetical protein BGZ98_000232 [Dissophora globulifera]